MVDRGSSLCHHVIHEGQSVCVVVFNGATYFMPDEVTTDFNSTVGEQTTSATSQLVLPATVNLGFEGKSCGGWLKMQHHGCEKIWADDKTRIVCKASTSHMLLALHAVTLAAMQCVYKNDFSDFDQCAVDNASSVTPLGAHMLHSMCFSARGSAKTSARGPMTPTGSPRGGQKRVGERHPTGMHCGIVYL